MGLNICDKKTAVGLHNQSGTLKTKNLVASLIQGDNNRVNVGADKVQEPVSYMKLIDNPVFNFTGRSDLLEEIEAEFEKAKGEKPDFVKTVVLYGLGGIGKTQVAQFYGNKKLDDGYSVAWIEAGSDSSVHTSFVAVARKLRICKDILVKPQISMGDIVHVAKEVYQHFSQHITNGLFIFNNAEEMKTSKLGFGIREFLPSEKLQNAPKILITSRKITWGSIGEKITPISVKPLSNDEVWEFLVRAFGLHECEDFLDLELKDLMQEFGSLFQGFVLALSRAAASIIDKSAREPELSGKSAAITCEEYFQSISPFLQRLRVGIKWYINRFNEPDADWIHDLATESQNDHYECIMSNVWGITLDKIAQCKGGEVALHLQNIFAYLNPDHIFVAACESIYFGKPYERYGIRRREQLLRTLWDLDSCYEMI